MNRTYLLLLVPLALLLLPAAQRSSPPSLQQTLQANEWKKRVLLVAAPTAEHPDFRAQKAQLATAPAQLSARDFLVIDVLYDQLSPADKNYLTKEIGVQPPRFATVLIGKDGRVKMKSARPIPLAKLFGTVDQMPMRKQEMQRGVIDTE
ncbi:MAG TPA: DUF4174 domain-containing protein [Hymenobacter sp.]|jgi:hypothetical protein|uniref:DUF4174 domain-containing protein n=1 Tax=Hymenobacter sp. TaxID=1898978 RepID=UPI002ED91F77